MIVSPRYLPAICGLFALALVPTLIHSYAEDVATDALATSTIPASLAGFASTPSARAKNWGKRRFDSDDWMERNYGRGGDQVRLTVIRSYDLKALYHHPELAVAYGGQFGSSFGTQDVTRFAARPDIPVHVLHPTPGDRALGLYVLYYDGAFVEHPLWFQFQTAGKLLFSRRKPMTLFFAHDFEVQESAEIEHLPSMELLFGAIEGFLAQTTVRPGQ